MDEPDFSLERARRLAGLSREELSRLSGVSADSIYSYERGRRAPSQASLRKLRAALPRAPERGTPPDRLTLATGLMRDEMYGHRWPSMAVNERDEVLWFSQGSDAFHGGQLSDTFPSLTELNLIWMSITTLVRNEFPSQAELALATTIQDEMSLPMTAPALQPRYFQALTERLTRAYGGLLPGALLRRTTDFRPAPGARHTYRIGWQTLDGPRVVFDGIVRCASLYDGIWVHDLHAASASTAEWLAGRSLNQPRLEQAREAANWNQLLRWGRGGLGMTRAVAAAQARLTVDALYSYERGRRRPTRPHLRALADAIELDAASFNVICHQLDFETEPSRLVGLNDAALAAALGGTPATLAQIRAAVLGYRWPCFVLDGDGDFVLVNEAARSMIGFEQESRPVEFHAERNLLRQLLGPSFRRHALNYERAFYGVLGANLWRPIVQGLPHPVPYVTKCLADAAAADPTLLGRLREDWQQRGRPPRSIRLTFPLVWDAGEETLEFDCVVSKWNVWDRWWVLDAHPADAKTWRWLQRRGRREPAGAAPAD